MTGPNYPWEEWDPLGEGSSWEEEVPVAPCEPTFADRWAPLSPRQKQVARLAAMGETNREIGQRLGISPETAKLHLHYAYIRLRIRDRRDLKDRMWREGPFRRL